MTESVSVIAETVERISQEKAAKWMRLKRKKQKTGGFEKTVNVGSDQRLLEI